MDSARIICPWRVTLYKNRLPVDVSLEAKGRLSALSRLPLILATMNEQLFRPVNFHYFPDKWGCFMG